jgi:hypothetical protein
MEKEIQTITEQKLEEIFKLELVTSEMELPGFRIDTLAFDKESSAFIIIEYKKDHQEMIPGLIAGLVISLIFIYSCSPIVFFTNDMSSYLLAIFIVILICRINLWDNTYLCYLVINRNRFGHIFELVK